MAVMVSMSAALSKMLRTSATVAAGRFALLMAFSAAWYSTTVGNACAASKPTPASAADDDEQGDDRDARLPKLCHSSSSPTLLSYRNEPIRPGLPKFIQIRKALPTMFLSGTKPQ